MSAATVSNDRLQANISVCKVPKPGERVRVTRDITISEALEEITTGRFAAEVAVVRRLVAIHGKDSEQVKAAKLKMPAYLFSGQVVGAVKQAMQEGRMDHSGILTLDFDGIEDAEIFRDELANDPHVIAAWISPSGNGVKGLCAIERATTEEQHKAAFLAAEAYFAGQGLEMDPSGKNSNRLCFAGSDPDARIRSGPARVLRQAPPQAAKPTQPPLVLSAHSRPFPEPPAHGVHQWLPQAARWCEQAGLSEAEAVAKLREQEPRLRRSYSHREPEDAARLVYDTPSGSRPAVEKMNGRPIINIDALVEAAYALRFDPSVTPPEDETCLVIADIPIGARGNLSVLGGKSKVGKGALVSAVLGSAQRGLEYGRGDTICIEWSGTDTGAIIHLDTEQSAADWHGLVTRSVTRSGRSSVSDRLLSLQLVRFSRKERMAILREVMRREKQDKGSVDLVVIDGVADLCVSPNDEAEALELVSQLHALAQEYHCAIFCVLHENPGAENGKTRGHLGSELNRKAFANLRIDKDTTTSVSTLYGTDMRKRDIPKEQGFCFAWDDTAGMHVFQGRAAGVKAAERDRKAIDESRSYWLKIYEMAQDIGTKTICPDLSPKEAVEIDRDISGTKKEMKADAMKKRMQRAEILGVLRKTQEGRWTLTTSGQSGQERDI